MNAQKKRQVKIALNLKQRLASYSESTKADFIIEARQEAEKIAGGAYGSLYCITIGYALLLQAEEFLGNETTLFGLGGFAARTKQSTSALGTNFKLIGAAFSAATHGARAMQEAENLQKATMDKTKEGGDGTDAAKTKKDKDWRRRQASDARLRVGENCRNRDATSRTFQFTETYTTRHHPAEVCQIFPQDAHCLYQPAQGCGKYNSAEIRNDF
ncbi:DnaJ (Hsp40) homolog subfamily C member [Seminavis robusta]|uniref:DnaJ (Hsp40) homolog subfamily C member n=1 Tax=Seminavis robusta TaxID=568900 RepID=A0A9N8F5J2_9STRA|nr:DnaJ (Hsp40) homolog subfamily C member [Seminavis robusta]|eukprot:Sro3444_g348100.1 DnaJ (Hsp40) homolog subfamily C member (214) ;mRNA; r:3969-4610